jgi:hypothetical protein
MGGTWAPYRGESYLDWPSVEAWCRGLAARHPDFVRLEEVGRSRMGRPLILLAIGRNLLDPLAGRPAVWVDGGTHAAEWTGVMAAIYTASRWVEGLAAGDAALSAWFDRAVAWIMPCLSPDGFQAMHEGAPYLRSTLRPPRQGELRSGLDPTDIDGDGAVRWMRWRHPAGPWVADAAHPVGMRPRSLDDDPAQAYFFAPEGELLTWDGVRWTAATLRHGLDLNRNFPAHWAPFSMFGMDGGAYPGSEPESRAAIDAVAARPGICAAVTHHTYTGALLTQPYRKDSPLPEPDLDLCERLAQEAVAGTGYRAIRVWPDFTYDDKKPIVGVWADTLCTVFGIPGYTLELWDPFAHCGETMGSPAAFFKRPDAAMVARMLARFAATPGSVEPWRPFEHPQLGPVEIGGVDYLRTVRNPPVSLLADECARGLRVADRLRAAIPRCEGRVVARQDGDLTVLELVVENLGFLATSCLAHAENLGVAPRVSATLFGDVSVVEGARTRDLGYLDGWGTAQVSTARHPLYPSLPDRGHRASARWSVRGSGPVEVRWDAGRGGAGVVRLSL